MITCTNCQHTIVINDIVLRGATSNQEEDYEDSSHPVAQGTTNAKKHANKLSKNSNNLSSHAQPHHPPHRKAKRNYAIYGRRWWVLFVFSALCCISHILTYSFAPINTRVSAYYQATEVQMSMFADVFFISYLFIAIPTSILIDRKGLRTTVVLGAWLQATGAVMRYGWELLFPELTPNDKYRVAMAGQIICALPQAVFGNAPPMVAAVWFPSSERALATTIGCSASLFGIALAYIISPIIVRDNVDGSDLPFMLELYSYLCIAFAVLATMYFPERPPCPPSYTAELKLREWIDYQAARLKQEYEKSMKAVGAVEKVFNHVPDTRRLSDKARARLRALLPFNTKSSADRKRDGETSIFSNIWAEVMVLLDFFKVKGFLHCVCGFAMSEAVGNVYAVAMNSEIIPLGLTVQFVSFMGIAFILSLVLGSLVVGIILEKLGPRYFKTLLVLCSLFLVLAQSWFSFIATGETGDRFLVGLSICLVGFFAGPLQPISLELAAECTYPSSETAFTSVMQIVANLFSAGLVPLLFWLRDIDKRSDRLTKGNFLLVFLLAALSMLLMTFRGEMKRSTRDLACGASTFSIHGVKQGRNSLVGSSSSADVYRADVLASINNNYLIEHPPKEDMPTSGSILPCSQSRASIWKNPRIVYNAEESDVEESSDNWRSSRRWRSSKASRSASQQHNNNNNDDTGNDHDHLQKPLLPDGSD
eukprot:gb/GEZN01002099.1/.p1 GENE.gb/GEZN01002099.1/~~gb/GEZN01002099.1/.p1  ORF type:complete len:740 (+),score=72.16 gb/GEZN01002099.1/:108-2222(+)